MTQPYQPALSFTSPTPIPRAAILAWIQQACNVQVAWLHAPQKQLGMQGKPGVQAWVYINVSRYKQYGVDDYREQSGVLLAGTISVTNGSDQVVFSQPQSLNAGDNIVFSSQPGQPYTFQGSTTDSTTATMMFPYTGPTNPVATTLDALAKNLTGQRRITVTCRAESFASEQSAHPIELLEAIRWYGRTFTNNILDLANCSYSDAGEIRTLPAVKSDNHLKIVAVMDLYFNFAVNDFPVGAQAPGDAGTVIETVNESEQLPTDQSTILGNGAVVVSPPIPPPVPPSPTMTFVRINANQSPYAAHPDQTIVVDTSLGSVIVNLPVLPLLSGQEVTVTQDQATSLASATVTINGPAGVQIAQPAPNNGTFANSYVMSGVESQGMSLSWYNGGSSGGYLLE